MRIRTINLCGLFGEIIHRQYYKKRDVTLNDQKLSLHQRCYFQNCNIKQNSKELSNDIVACVSVYKKTLIFSLPRLTRKIILIL